MITVYSSEGCVQCTATYRAMDKAGIDYTVIDVTHDDETRDWLKGSFGYRQVPVVVVGDDHWAGYRPERIRNIPDHLRRAAASAASAPDPPVQEATTNRGGQANGAVEAVEQWTARVRQAAAETGQVPELGSPEWIDLADTDPRKLAAVVESALAHTRAQTPTSPAAATVVDAGRSAYEVGSTAHARRADFPLPASAALTTPSADPGLGIETSDRDDMRARQIPAHQPISASMSI